MVTMALRPYVQGQVYKEGWNLNAWLGLSLGGMIALQVCSSWSLACRMLLAMASAAADLFLVWGVTSVVRDAARRRRRRR